MEEKNDYQLYLKDIHLSFGGIKALHGVTTGVRKGEIFSIIGPNGAGKTCLLNCINRFYQPERGNILFEGRDITQSNPTASQSWALPEPFRMWSCSDI